MSIQLDHIAFGVPRVAEIAPFVVGELGGTPDMGGPAPEYWGGQWAFADGARLEFLEPSGAGFMQRFVDRRGAGVHHVTFNVPDLHASCERARALGYDVVGLNDAHPAWMEAFLHPKQAQGIVIQLAETHPEAGEDSWGMDWSPPPGPSPSPVPVRILGVRLRSRSAERARLQWAELCGGQEGEPLVFRWPGSPLRIAVDVVAEADEGPVCIEVQSERALSLDGAPALLGAPFRQLA